MLKVPMSNGELLDKLSILELKQEKIEGNSSKEYHLLSELASVLLAQPGIPEEYETLKKINNDMWDIEDNIRIKERENDFGPEFIRLARAVYANNDLRFRQKHKLNMLTNSGLVEEKSYV